MFIKGKDSLITSIIMLMIPKTIAYVWIVLMGWKLSMSPGRKKQSLVTNLPVKIVALL